MPERVAVRFGGGEPVVGIEWRRRRRGRWRRSRARWAGRDIEAVREVEGVGEGGLRAIAVRRCGRASGARPSATSHRVMEVRVRVGIQCERALEVSLAGAVAEGAGDDALVDLED